MFSSSNSSQHRCSFLNSPKHLRYWECLPPGPGNLSVSRDVTSVRGIAYTQCIRTMHNVKPGEGSELKRVNARNREDPYRVQRLGVILVGGGPYPFQPCHNAMLGFRHFSSWKSHGISATVAEPCFGTSLWKWTFLSLCNNMQLRRGTHSRIILDRLNQGFLTISSRGNGIVLWRGRKKSSDIIDILIFLITIRIIILVSHRG